MTKPENQSSILADIEARQDDALVQLDQLNTRVEQILSEYLAARDYKTNLTNRSNAA